jgi:uncharacterized protein YbaA (DUF1428 family)
MGLLPRFPPPIVKFTRITPKRLPQSLRSNGALRFVECWGDDVPEGKLTSFPMAVKRQDDETVVFSWVIWPSRNVRDQGMKKVMSDPRLQPENNPMPFDGKRMIYGGFEMIVDA